MGVELSGYVVHYVFVHLHNALYSNAYTAHTFTQYMLLLHST